MNVELINYIKQIVTYRLSLELSEEEIEFPLYDFSKDKSTFSRFVEENNLALPEIIALLIALLPHIAPGFLSNVLSEYLPNGGDILEFGGVKSKNYRGILPTAETVLYIICGNDIEKRMLVAKIFEEEHFFHQKNILTLSTTEIGEPKWSGKLLIDQEILDLFLYGQVSKPKTGTDFPAELIQTKLDWKDLVLNPKTEKEVNDILVWLKYNEQVLEKWHLKNKVKPGYKALFYGPPGTGKTLTANLLGKKTGKDVYRIDLSLVVSKYIGETEKNLSKLFDKAKNKNWILFFDEADSILGIRTGVRDSHDKYANQEVSYLLQRIETHPGLMIFATNYKSNIDKAFTRRFHSFVAFENPNKEERLELWQKYIPKNLISKNFNLEEIAKKFDVTGANIVNIVQYACLQTMEQGKKKLDYDVLVNAIKREYVKEGRMI